MFAVNELIHWSTQGLLEQANICSLIKEKNFYIEGDEEKIEFISSTEVQPSTTEL